MSILQLTSKYTGQEMGRKSAYAQAKREEMNRFKKEENNKKARREIYAKKRESEIIQWGLKGKDIKFKHCSRHHLLDRLTLDHGHIVLLDKNDSKLIAICRFIERDDEDPEVVRLFENYESMLPQIYQHAIARQPIKTNGAFETMGKKKQGQMFPMGFRPGYKRGVKAGYYAYRTEVARHTEQMKRDRARMKFFPEIENFWAEQFCSLSLHAFESNTAVAACHRCPSWAWKNFYHSPNAKVFGSNIFVTRDGFRNQPHQDRDATAFAFGMWALMDRNNGKLVPSSQAIRSPALGSRFLFNDYNIEVDFDKCNGVVEMVWATDVTHQTIHPDIKKYYGQHEAHLQAEVLGGEVDIIRFGSSTQITCSMDRAMKGIVESGGADEEWKEHVGGLTEDWDHEFQTKMEQHWRIVKFEEGLKHGFVIIDEDD